MRHLVIEIPSGWVHLGPNTLAVPLEDVGNLFDGGALMRATEGIPPAITETLCDEFISNIQKQRVMSMLHTHEEEVTQDKKPVSKTVAKAVTKYPDSEED